MDAMSVGIDVLGTVGIRRRQRREHLAVIFVGSIEKEQLRQGGKPTILGPRHQGFQVFIPIVTARP